MKKVAIIGAGISGLFIANLFKKNTDYQITIYEKNNLVFSEEGYGVQLSVNSIKFLNEIGFDKLNLNEKFFPEKINFYSTLSPNKICELNISEFNTEDCKYTTLKRSTLINFLKKDLVDLIKFGYNISKIDHNNNQIKLSFDSHETKKCDFLIISDGVFSKSKSLILSNQAKPKYNNTLAIRGIISKYPENLDNKNISLFLGSDFHHVIYPVNQNGDLNFIAIMKYHLSKEEQKNYSLFSDNSFTQKVIRKIPLVNKNFLDNLKELKIFPVFVSDNFYKIKNNNIHLIGDAFFAFPPSFAQGASQSIESAYELFRNVINKTESNFFESRIKKTKMVNIRSKINQFGFHLSNPITIFLRNKFLKRLVKNKKFLEIYLGKIYKS
tara:strand:- start:356 stop:1501 length:1146 start_codon:yes stop_codon:yes gene_type:complete